MRKEQTTFDECAPHWAAGIADASLEREQAPLDHDRLQLAARAALCEALRVSGTVWIDRVDADARSAAATMNARAGRPLLAVQRSPTGAIAVQGGSHGYVLFAPDLNTESGNTPGVMVTVQRRGAGGASPYLFELLGAALVLRCYGELVGPERFAELMLRPFLTALPLRGR